MFAGIALFDEQTFSSFHGTLFTLANAWEKYIDIDEYKDRPITYLEIGAFHGANAISVAHSYALHPESKLHLIDPWEDYSEYPEYRVVGQIRPPLKGRAYLAYNTTVGK